MRIAQSPADRALLALFRRSREDLRPSADFHRAPAPQAPRSDVLPCQTTRRVDTCASTLRAILNVPDSRTQSKAEPDARGMCPQPEYHPLPSDMSSLSGCAKRSSAKTAARTLYLSELPSGFPVCARSSDRAHPREVGAPFRARPLPRKSACSHAPRRTNSVLRRSCAP